MRKVVLGIVTLIIVSAAISPGGRARAIYPWHDVMVGEIDGTQKLVMHLGGEVFTLRGNNYTRLIWYEDGASVPFQYHSLFDLGQYNADEVDEDLDLMQRLGYNTVRVYINHLPPNGIGDLADGDGLSAGYMDNVTDFLDRALNYGIYVIIVGGWTPDVEPYRSALNNTYDPHIGGGNNQIYLTEGGVQAHEMFWSDFINELTYRAYFENILAYQIQNEFFYDTSQLPFNLGGFDPDTGEPLILATPDGYTYDLSDPSQVRAMQDSNMKYFIERVSASIKVNDPLALVTMGFFVPFYGNYREVETRPAIEESVLDFVDLHVYPHEFWDDWSNYAAAFGDISEATYKPVIIGELGAFRGEFGSIPPVYEYQHDYEARNTLVEWMSLSCHSGADGWLTWTWDTNEQVNSMTMTENFYSALGDASLGDTGVELAVGPVRWDGSPAPLVDPYNDIVGHIGFWLSPQAISDPCEQWVIEEAPGAP